MVIAISCKGPVGLFRHSLIMLILFSSSRSGSKRRRDETQTERKTLRLSRLSENPALDSYGIVEAQKIAFVM